jgi:hypothetical protein
VQTLHVSCQQDNYLRAVAVLITDVDVGPSLTLWGTAEIATTIMAASIPVLRVLIRDMGHTVGRYIREVATNAGDAEEKMDGEGYHGSSRRGIFYNQGTENGSCTQGRAAQSIGTVQVSRSKSDTDAGSYELGRFSGQYSV